MRAPVHQLKVAEIRWLGSHKCKHSHTYLEHYNCYLNDFPERFPRTGSFDIEATNLKATFGIVLCWCILDHQTGEIHQSIITKKDLAGDMDKRVMLELIQTMELFDVLVTWYGTKFDFPYVRTRSIHHGLDFPPYGALKHIDMYYTSRAKLAMHSNRLAVASEFLLGATEKTTIDSERWIRALQGHKESLDYILDHCQRDVRDLKRVYDLLLPYRYPSLKSI